MNELVNSVNRALPRINVVFSPDQNSLAFNIAPPRPRSAPATNPLERAEIKVRDPAAGSGIVFY